jgi:hypothetical protein
VRVWCQVGPGDEVHLLGVSHVTQRSCGPSEAHFDSPPQKIEFYSSLTDKLGLPPLPMHKVD